MTSTKLFTCLKEFLADKGIVMQKIVGFGSDGASIMTGLE